MSLAGYFRNVGAALLALLWIADFYLPRPPAAQTTTIDQPAIRIHSDRKWPERVVFDTSTPAVSTAASDRNLEASIAAAAWPASSAVTARPGDAFAMLPRADTREVDSARQDKPQLKVVAKTPRKKARPRILTASPERQFAWFGFRPWVVEGQGRQRWN